jgi:hypothetical protein
MSPRGTEQLQTRARTGGPTAGALPNLVVIGAMKCGTSSLHRYLDLHPAIAMSALKEPNFFLTTQWGTWDRGTDWYRGLFDPRAPVRGEASVNYTGLPFSEGTAERMRETLGPDVKLIYMVRDPIERAVSHYLHARAAGRERRTLAEGLGNFETRYVLRSMYATQLEPFVEAFGAERIHVDTQAALLRDRAATMRRIFRFLEVDEEFTSPQFERLWEVSAGKTRKFTIAYRLTRRLGGTERWGTLPLPLRWLGERVTLARGRKGGVPRPQVPPELQTRLAEHFAPEVARLRELSGLRLEGWCV